MLSVQYKIGVEFGHYLIFEEELEWASSLEDNPSCRESCKILVELVGILEILLPEWIYNKMMITFAKADAQSVHNNILLSQSVVGQGHLQPDNLLRINLRCFGPWHQYFVNDVMP